MIRLQYKLKASAAIFWDLAGTKVWDSEASYTSQAIAIPIRYAY